MKKNLLIISTILFSFQGINAQVNLIGTSNNQSSGNLDIVKWQALDSASQTTYPTDLVAYLLGSSVFDAYNSNYYLSGFTDTSYGLFAFNTETTIQTLSNFTAFSNITEIDMSTGKIYNLRADSIDYIVVNEYDIKTGTDSLLGTIYEPGILGIVVDATGFDSNNGILYYIGYDGTPALCLYGISVRSAVFSYTKTIIQASAPVNNITSVNYDNVNNTIFALNAEFGNQGNYLGSNVVEVNKVTGEVSTRGQLTEFPWFVVGSSSFDQNSGSLLLVGLDTSFVQKMIVFNTTDNTYQTGYVPGSVSEIVCDNAAFARSTYTTTGIPEMPEFAVNLYPNPADNQINLIFGTEDTGDKRLSIFNMNGQLVFSKEIPVNSGNNIDVSLLESGIYLLQVSSEKAVETRKLVIQ